MIAASEPLEFIPRGRLAVEEHSGPLKTKQQMSASNDNLLLLRMQSVNISRNDEYADEHWSIQDIYEDYVDKNEIPKCTTNSLIDNPSYMIDFYVNSEEELYYKGHTAVWVKGIDLNGSVLPKMCFTTDTPIKHAFFCNQNFLKQKQTVNTKTTANNITAIGIIDITSLRVYCDSGEYFLTNLEFPISNVFQTKFGILLEKEAFSTTIRSHLIPMPRIFSLSHPLNEMCPLIYKSSIGHVSYLTEADYKIIFTTNNNDLVFFYDTKIGKHFICRLRPVSEDEINFISCVNSESIISGVNVSYRQGVSNLSQGLYKSSTSMTSRSNITQTTRPRNSNLLKLITNSSQAHHSINSSNNSNVNRTNNFQSPLTQLQSTFKTQSISVQDLRKFGQSISQPSKPIFPEYCLEHIWTENINSKDFCETASKAFTHIDLIGQNYLCYLLSQACELQMMRIEKASSPDNYIFGMISTVAAKDAVVLDKMKMIAILTPCGTLVLYTGPVLIAKVHITSVLPNFVSQRVGTYSFPRRSSLLPTIQQPVDVPFDDELHMLSPVHPLTSHFSQRNNNVCQGLRDPSGNRLTLIYSEGKMYRIALPLVNESHFITKCIFALKQVVKKDLYIQLLAKWYSARNAPGSQDFSNEQEWETFKNVLSDLLGRSFSLNESNSNNSGSEEPKKRRKNENSFGSVDDWDYVMKISNSQTAVINDQLNSILHNDASAPLFSYIPVIFYTLHLVYEEIKLDSSMISYLKYLAEFLYSLAADMQLHSYCLHYFLDFPQLIHNCTKNFFTEVDAQKMNNKNLLIEPVPSIYNIIVDILRDNENNKYPHFYNVNTMSKNIIQLITLICHGHTKLKKWFRNLEFAGCGNIDTSKLPKKVISVNVPRSEQVIQMLLQMNMTRIDIQRLPPAINFIIAQALEYSRLSPPTGYEFRAYELILRSELVVHASYNSNSTETKSSSRQHSSFIKEDALTPRIVLSSDIIPTAVDASTLSEGDGMENIDTKLLRLRFPHDLRTTEVRRMLNSSESVIIDIKQSAGVSDHEFIEEQEKQLYALCTRTMALPMGRGMLTLRTTAPSSTESIPIPKLCLSGKEPTKGATIEMQQIEFPPNMNVWPSFHNGVAAGLRISQNAKNIDSTWIVYNKPKGQTEVSNEHAGFLMGLGLNGHLKSLSFMSIYEYLVKCDEMTGVGLLLGISATHRGTMDNTTTKLLSVHIEALLPATALELDIPQNIQVASLMGVGLLYQGTAKRHIAEVLLQEIGRPPGPEMENSVERESYALTAGLALGLVTLGQGESPAGLQDLQLPDTLHYYIVGGNKRPLTGSQKEKYKLPSFPVREGDTVNIDVTAPGAILALGLMFFNTGNTTVAQWMKPPDTSYLLDLIRPDLLLLRIIARGLILWKDIQSDFKWLSNQFPSSLAFDLKKGPPDNGLDVDHEANAQAYCNITAGAAFCIGLKYAGTENPIAFKSLKKTIDIFLGMCGQYVGEYAGKATVESCLVIVVLSISLVFAGSGNLEILRIIRYLRSRIGASYPQVTYGSHMAIHMALGFLFMGAGRYTLSKTPEAIAALVCALFPKFPNHSNDNRYHLQAFRHLYVLAVEPRLFLPRDIDTGKLCLCQISCIEINSKEIKNLPMAPCILPELNTLKMIMVNDPNYWPVCFHRERNWDQLQHILENSGCIDIKKRAGCMSLLEDPDRLKSLLAQTLTTEQYSCWKTDPKSLLLFSNDTKVATFTQKCLEIEKSKDDITNEEVRRSQMFMILFYKCLTKDKMHALPIYISLLHILEKLEDFPSTQDIWQFKIISAFQNVDDGDILISKEIVDSIMCKLTTIMEIWRDMYSEALKEFISYPNAIIILNASLKCLQKIISVISFYDLLPNALNVIHINNHKINYIVLLCELKKYGFNANTINCIAKLLNVN